MKNSQVQHAPSAGLVRAAAVQTLPPVATEKMERLQKKAKECRGYLEERWNLEDRLELIKARIVEIEQKELVDLFSECGISAITLEAEGNHPAYTLERKPYYHANIPEESRDSAATWLEETGHGDLLRSVVTISLGKKEVKTVRRIEKMLRNMGVEYSTKFGVPWNTLTAWVRERVEKYNEVLPLDLLGAKVGEIVKLKLKD
jgi:hypothetical protein